MMMWLLTEKYPPAEVPDYDFHKLRVSVRFYQNLQEILLL